MALDEEMGESSGVEMEDEEILASLEAQQGLVAVECGGGGNCLFLSIADQVTSEQILRAERFCNSQGVTDALAEAGDWESLGRRRRSKLLRLITVGSEARLLEGDEPAWREALFLDMAMELLVSNPTRT